MSEETFQLDYIPGMCTNTSYRIGIIGSGFIIRECHLPAYREAGYQVVGIASRMKANAEAVASEFGIPKVYDTIQELLDDPSVDVVDIAVPPHMQPELIAMAARAGKHILAQKPLAVTYKEAVETVRICQEAGVQLLVNQNGRFDPAVMAAKDLIQKGIVGKPVYATIELRYKPHWQEYQKQYERLMFLFMGIHHLDQFRYWFGTPERIFASSIRQPEGEFIGEYSSSYILEYENGLLASAWDDGFTWDEESFGVFYKIEGTEGVVRLNIGWPSGGPSQISYMSKKLDSQWHSPKLSGSWFPGAFKYTMNEMFRSLTDGNESMISGRNNLETMAMMEACYASIEKKRSIQISEIIQSAAWQ
ncbi:Gfo/Idh/MocA family protein [Paenibacillus spongiae]|uniref:Gfo/Idh/MocA family oxidoreductase n=1 Tax=Paenibacillus spongiae TaxID=2909671 RepID=A0ABY5SHZ4_9BACL|nr:Gfo/Idh/MocA family oxidoreductase [Paenibacillus spongiae]UVI33203.1 Gfo/Idh/MocA family oxidoreductase [Paenibacillus spongiae]